MAKPEKSGVGAAVGRRNIHADLMVYARTQFFDDAPDLMYMVSTHGKILDANRKALQTLGYEKKDLLGQPVTFLYSPGSLERAKEAFTEWKKTGSVHAELDVKKKSGETLPVDLNVSSVYGENGEVVCSVSIQRDITKRRKAERALRESEERLRAIFESTIDYIGVWDKNHRLLYANKVTARFFTDNVEGVDEDDVVGVDISDVLHEMPEHAQMWVERIDSVFETGEPMFVEEKVESGLRTAYNESNLYPLKDEQGNVFAVSVIVRDVTESKRAKREIKERDERIRAIFDAVTDVSFIITTFEGEDSRVVEFSSGAENIFGYAKDEIRGKPVALLHLPEDVEKFPEFQQELKKRKIGFSGETTLVRKSGEKFPALFHLQPIFNAEGEVDSALGVSLDISELKVAEQLRMENLALEETGRLKNEFMASMSHDLRTPLNAIIGYSELLMDEGYGGLNEKQGEYMGIIHSNGESLLGLIDDVLDLSSVEAGMLNLKFIILDVADIVRNTTNALAILAEKKHQLVEINVDDGVNVWADNLRLKQSLNNLLSNAIKYTPDGGLIKIAAVEVDGMVEISISDTGKGVEPENLDIIFEPFFRVELSKKTEVKSTGLGLHITRKLVELMGGEIWAESTPGKGSTFFIRLHARPPQDTGYKNAVTTGKAE